MTDIEEDYEYYDEELDEIDYYEIVSLDDIIKLNPTFVAFSNEEIYNYLFAFFNSRSKSEFFLKLFTIVIEKQQNSINTKNIIVVADAKRNDFQELDIEEFITKLKNSSKDYKNKNKIWFPLIYDDENSKIKFRASSTTIIDLTIPNNNDRYIIFKDDERDIPVMGVYFYEPVVIEDNYLNERIASFLIKERQRDEMKLSDTFKTFEELIINCNNNIKLPIDKIDEDEFYYENINTLFKRFNKDIDNINIKDFDLVKNHLNELTKKEVPVDIKYNKVDLKPNTSFKNFRFHFFKSIKDTFKLLDITLKSSSKLKGRLEELTKIEKTEPLPIIDDLNKLISNLNEANFDDIIANIKAVRKNLSVDNCITAINNYLKNDKETILKLFEKTENKFQLLLNNYKDIYKIDFHFDYEEKQAKLAADTSNYEGVPTRVDEYKKDTTYINEDEDEEGEEEIVVNPYDEFKRYFHNLEKGFSEAMKIILPLLANLKETSKLPINYDLIFTHLFNIYRGIPQKEVFVRKALGEGFDDDYYKEQSLKAIKFVLESESEDAKLKEANLEYIQTILNPIIYDSICKWTILTQNDVLSESLLFVKDRCFVPCIHLWNDYGAPYDMARKDGILYYLICVFKEIYKEEYKLEDNYKEIIIKKINDNYQEELSNFNKIEVKKRKRENKGLEAGNKLIKLYKNKEYKTDKFIETFIEALIYMPSYKFEKIHKYLLGCCLEQIDENFNADTYLKLTRDDLKKAKAKLAEERVLNKPRNKRFFIQVEQKKEELIKFTPISNFINYENFYNSSLDDWFKELEKSKTYLLKSHINDIKTKIRNTYIIHTTTYLEKFFSKNLMNVLNDKNFHFDNYKQLLLAISSILFKHLNKNAMVFINNINQIISLLDKLSSIINDDNITDIRQIRAIIIIRAMCLPAIPDITSNPKLTPSIEMESSLSKTITSEIDKKILGILQNGKMPTQEDQVNYINKIREANKNKILASLNKKTREEKDALKALKKVGIVIDDDEEFERPVNKERKEDGEEDGDFDLGHEDDEYDDDNLDGSNYGFIYASEGSRDYI